MFGVEKCSMSGSLLPEPAWPSARELELAYGILSGSCTWASLLPSCNNYDSELGILLILYSRRHCIPIVGGSSAFVKGDGAADGRGWKLVSKAAYICLIALYFITNPFLST
jgi:hypothetical protein